MTALKRFKLIPRQLQTKTQTMRGADTFTESLFTMRRLEDFVPANHPLRPIRAMVNEALLKMDDLFARMYEADIKGGRPSIAPEKLLRAMLLQIFFSVRSERQLMEQTQYNLLYRWFIGLAMDDAVWVPSVFTKNRELVGDNCLVASATVTKNRYSAAARASQRSIKWRCTRAWSIQLNCSGTWRSRSGRSSCLTVFTAAPVDYVVTQLYEAPGGAGHVLL